MYIIAIHCPHHIQEAFICIIPLLLLAHMTLWRCRLYSVSIDAIESMIRSLHTILQFLISKVHDAVTT